jgi:hypothetical protein
MFQSVMTIVRWCSIPVLLAASMFSGMIGNYELPLDLIVSLGALYLAQRAVRSADYPWAAALGAVVIAFSPLLPVDQIFLFMGYAVIAISLALATVFRPRPAVAGL